MEYKDITISNNAIPSTIKAKPDSTRAKELGCICYEGWIIEECSYHNDGVRLQSSK